MNKHITGKQSVYKGKDSSNNFFFGRVVSNTDPADGNRIKVRIKGVDDHIVNNTDLVFCNPLLPKFINITPKVGETVYILLPHNGNDYENRVYVGPIISQPQKLNRDNHYYTSLSMFNNGFTGPNEAPSKIPEAKGVYPKPEDIALQGRKNSDIIFKDSEILLRAGKHSSDDNLKFNTKNPAYIQLKFDSNIGKDKKGSVINVVSDKINLLTHSNGSPNFNLTNQDSMISELELKKIIEQAHPLPFGDTLVKFLNLVKEYIANHKHPYHGMPADKDKITNDILNFNLEGILSNNIRIN